MRPDKKKVVDEVWDQERISSFLDKAPLGEGANPDFSVLLYAYRSMRSEDFEQFIAAFKADKRDLDAQDHANRSLLDLISNHRKAQPFIDILRNAGANSAR